jgi:DNA-binding NarL/FixJ family response regulator
VTMTDEPPAVRALLIDDHQLLAQSLSLALSLEGVTCAVAELDDRDQLVARVRSCPPDLVLLDLELGGAIGDGSELVAPFVEAGCTVLVVSASADRHVHGRALEQGAAGIVSKNVPFGELLATALAAARGEQVMEPALRQRVLGELRAERSRRAEVEAPFRRLTDRETQVLRALADGLSVGTIAKQWFVSEATVRSQVRGVLTKLGVSSQLEAVALAHRCSWLSPA